MRQGTTLTMLARHWLFAAGFADSLIVDGVQPGHIPSRHVYGPFGEHDRDFAVDSRLNWKIATGPLQHTVLGGIDYRRSRTALLDRGGRLPGRQQHDRHSRSGLQRTAASWHLPPAPRGRRRGRGAQSAAGPQAPQP
ncbi:hypothetical protein [Solimonas soli]|uniref:hypothetical protein n=1 Tax=Solimonas soli TaxID=413479 RepID=UPI000487F613|nr:hypothetical protein [Solimonas soli]